MCCRMLKKFRRMRMEPFPPKSRNIFYAAQLFIACRKSRAEHGDVVASDAGDATREST